MHDSHILSKGLSPYGPADRSGIASSCRRSNRCRDGEIRSLRINTGTAGTGADGLARARSTCAVLARLLGCAQEQVLPFSTGVIMETLPHDRIEAALPAVLADCQTATQYPLRNAFGAKH